MKILVTGGLGFIGSHTSVLLLEQGHDVVIVDDLSNSHKGVALNIEKITGKKPIVYYRDIADYFELQGILQDHDINAVIHFAGHKNTVQSQNYPLDYYENNLIGTLCLLRLCNEYNIDKFVFSSSAIVYGKNTPPLYEDMELPPPITPYANTKLTIERILEDYSASRSSFKAISLRYFNPIGAHPSGLIGENPRDTPTNIMPVLMDNVYSETPIKVFGKDYDTKDGTAIRDYIHVMDLAQAHINALENLDYTYQVFNIGTGIGNSVLELIKTFGKTNKVDVLYNFTNRRPNEIPISFANVTKSSIYLDFEATLPLERMVKDSYNYYIKNKGDNHNE